MEFNHDRGHAFTYNGTVYYSPNCARSFPPLPKTPPKFDFHPTSDKYTDYLQPRWLSSPFGYLAFIPTEPHFIGPLFSCLRDSQVHFVRLMDGKFSLEPSVAAAWRELENGLAVVTDFLKNMDAVDCLIARPPLPSMLYFRKSWTNARWGREQVIRSRDWFLVWIGVAAFLVAQAEDKIETFDEIPFWYTQFLQSHPSFPQSWLDDFRSFIHNYLVNAFRRVGCLVDPFEPGIPRLSWLTKWNIPYWYCWGPAQDRLVDIRSQLSYLRPPTHVLKAATAYTAPPPPPSPTSSSTQTGPLPPFSPSQDDADPGKEFRERMRARDAYIKSRPWKEFFDARQTALVAYLANETPQQRMKRENRARNPPTVTAEVFEWDWSDDDKYKLVRRRVPKKQCEHALHSLYNRCEYDPRLNVWEVCRYFDFGAYGSGEGDDGDEDDDDEDDGYACIDPLWSPTRPSDQLALTDEMLENQVEAELQSRLGQSLVAREEAKLEVDLFEDVDVPEYLAILYGFLWPIPWPNTPANSATWSNIIKNIGLQSTTPIHPSIPAIIIDFIEGLCSKSKQSPPGALFDLNPGSRLPIPIPNLCEDISKSGDFFIVQDSAYKREESYAWKIALTSAADAVRAFRLIQGGIRSPICLSLRLADLGITFRTLQPLPFRPTASLSSPPSMIPVRINSHVFTADDYSAYISRRSGILSSPRARAALLAGGLIWRLALEHIGKEVVSSGPTAAVVQDGLGFVFKASDGKLYGDDELTTEEIGVICGLYKCKTEQANQTKMLSWWPLPLKWYNHAANAYHWGHWTELDEEWFQRRSTQLSKGLAQPLQPTQWRNQLKGASSWRTTVDRHAIAAGKLYP